MTHYAALVYTDRILLVLAHENDPDCECASSEASLMKCPCHGIGAEPFDHKPGCDC